MFDSIGSDREIVAHGDGHGAFVVGGVEDGERWKLDLLLRPIVQPARRRADRAEARLKHLSGGHALRHGDADARPLALWERVRVRAVGHCPLALWERVRVRAVGSVGRPHPRPLSRKRERGDSTSPLALCWGGS